MNNTAMSDTERRSFYTVDEEPVKKIALPKTINVGQVERMGSGIAGAALLIGGLRRRGFSGLLAALTGASLVYRGVSGHCSLYKALGVSTAANKNEAAWERGIKLEKSIVIQRPPNDLYQFWRKLENLPQIMSNLISVKQFGDTLSYWVARGPAGKNIEWSSEIVNDVPDQIIAWKSLPESEFESAGSIRFEPLQDGLVTDVRVSMQYNPPAGAMGDALASLLGKSPESQLEETLRQFKTKMEADTAEVAVQTGGTTYLNPDLE